MTFSNKNVTRTFTSPNTKNAWGYIDTIGWRKVKTSSTDGVTNMFVILCAAKANSRKVSGNIDGSNQLTYLYLL
jgi:hypothetical protein